MAAELGVGVVYWPALEPLLRSEAGLVDVIEIEPQTLWLRSRDAEDPYLVDPDAVARIRVLPQVKLVHGVGFPVGGSRPPDPRHLSPLVSAVGALDAVWASEHLSFNQAVGARGPFQTGFLLPPRQTLDGARAAARTIRELAARLPVPFAVETGVNYLSPRSDELPDGRFLACVVEAADCGILLDLHNLWANERNGRQSVEEFLTQIPLERVWEVHLAGGFEMDGYWLDAHSDAIPGELLRLAAKVIPTLPCLGAILFEVLPAFIGKLGLNVVRDQIESLRRLWDRRGHRAPRVPPVNLVIESDSPAEDRDDRPWSSLFEEIDVRTKLNESLMSWRPPAPRIWEDSLGALVVGTTPQVELDLQLLADPGLAVLEKLVSSSRAGMIADALKLTTRLLVLTLGETGFLELLRRFWQTATPALFASAEAEAFADFLRSQDPGVSALRAVVEFEVALARAALEGETTRVIFPEDPDQLLGALAVGRLPETVTPGRFELLVEAER